MKWVMKTSRIIIATQEGDAMFRSFKECPLDVLRRLKDTLPGPNACTVVITNREALEAIRSKTIAVPGRAQPESLPDERAREDFRLPRWQVIAGTVLGALATLTGFLVWAMHSG